MESGESGESGEGEARAVDGGGNELGHAEEEEEEEEEVVEEEEEEGAQFSLISQSGVETVHLWKCCFVPLDLNL
ncbi:unnamed protein product [Pleuronectes platessa]|uniref:Uncharacterized protein n=1 Tax=Pleuronectes platessa TaxID=8262 RepID=A0A9N7YRD5_PLEPL|nr:unnamed protein product [Pleuronectes platessa]